MNVLILSKKRDFVRICYLRMFSDKAKCGVPAGLEEKPNPHDVTTDYIGPPDKESNIRPYVRYISKDETPLSRELRKKRIEVEEWNQVFWSNHNKRFYNEKEDFIRIHKLAGIDQISAEKMSQFYKSFLDKNKRAHVYYNISWYLKNIDLVILSGQVNLQRLWRKLRN